MKYFTPELYTRLQNRDPDEIDAADAKWERAEKKYEARLKSIRSKLPQSALHLVDELRFHDADVLWMGQASIMFLVLLRLDSTSRANLGLSYLIRGSPRIEHGLFPPEHCTANMQWTYDEVDIGDDPNTFKHSILFSNGSQLELDAVRLDVASVDTLYVASQLSVPA